MRKNRHEDYLNPHQAAVSESLILMTHIGSRTRLGPSMDPNMAFYILAIFWHSMQQKWDQGTLGTQRSTLFGSRTRLDLSRDAAMGLQYT